MANMVATASKAPGKTPYGKEYEIVTVTWLSDDAAGTASCTVVLNGWLVKSVTDPGAAAPTDNYDITLVQDGGDHLAGALADRDTANTEVVIHSSPIWLSGSFTFTIAAAGNAKNGTCYFHLVEDL